MSTNSIPSVTGVSGYLASYSGPSQNQAELPQKPTDTPSNVQTDVHSAQLLKKSDRELSVSEKALKRVIEKINKDIMGPPTKMEYSVHKPTNTIVVKVVNADTNEVLREIPPEKLLDAADQLEKLAGMIIDEKR